MRNFLTGKKTYLAAIVAALTALGSYLAGDMTGAEAIQVGATAVIGALLRAGSKADAEAVARGGVVR